MKCEDCKYWTELFKNYGKSAERVIDAVGHPLGWCTRHAPTGQEEEKFPKTCNYNSCAEFECRETEIEKLKNSNFRLRNSLHDEMYVRTELRHELREWRQWVLKLALPLNGCNKNTTTKKLKKIIEDKLTVK